MKVQSSFLQVEGQFAGALSSLLHGYSLTCLQETEGVHEPSRPRGEYNAAIMLPTKMELAKQLVQKHHL